MKNKSYLFALLTLCLLLILSAEYGTAQEMTSETSPLSPDETEAMVMSRIPIQGQLTDNTGDPLTGNYSVTFRLYDSATDGTQLCQDTQALALDNGLFSTAMQGCTVSDINGRQVYLGIQVGSDPEMTPRQPIYPVPYAYSLVPGADLRGALSGQSMLTVENSSSEFSTAISGLSSAPTGMNYGVHGKSSSATGYGGYFENSAGTALKAAGSGVIQSTALSHIWISGNGVRPADPNDTTTITMISTGTATIRRGAIAGNRYIILPITVPGVLYGQNVKVTHLFIYWRGDAIADNITAVKLARQSSPFAQFPIVDQEPTNFTCADELYPNGCTIHYTLTTNNVLTQDSGILGLMLGLNFESVSSSISIGGVRLVLEHD